MLMSMLQKMKLDIKHLTGREAIELINRKCTPLPVSYNRYNNNSFFFAVYIVNRK